MGFNSAFKGLKLLKTPGTGVLNNLNDPSRSQCVNVSHIWCSCLLHPRFISSCCTKLSFCTATCFNRLLYPSSWSCNITKIQAACHMSVNGRLPYISLTQQSVYRGIFGWIYWAAISGLAYMVLPKISENLNILRKPLVLQTCMARYLWLYLSTVSQPTGVFVSARVSEFWLFSLHRFHVCLLLSKWRVVRSKEFAVNFASGSTKLHLRPTEC